MTQQDRHERHLMRQRGAGSRTLGTAFGFQFAPGVKDGEQSAAPHPPKRTPSRKNSLVRRQSSARRVRMPSTIHRASNALAEELPSHKPCASNGDTSKLERMGTEEDAITETAQPAQSSPIRKARFREHLDEEEHEIPQPVKPVRMPSTRRKKRKTIVMPRRKRAAPKKAPALAASTEIDAPAPAQVTTEPVETDNDRADLVEAGLLDDSDLPRLSGSRKRKQAEIAELQQAQDSSAKKAKVQPPPFADQPAKTMRSSPSMARLREVFKLHSSKVNVSAPPPLSDSRPSTATTEASSSLKTVSSAENIDPAIELSPKKAASKVSKARRMFRIRDADGSGDESWFRPRRRKEVTS